MLEKNLRNQVRASDDQIFKADEKVSRVFEYEAVEAGSYVLDAHYRIVVNDVSIQ